MVKLLGEAYYLHVFLSWFITNVFLGAALNFPVIFGEQCLVCTDFI
jgi:hypothetical protein